VVAWGYNAYGVTNVPVGLSNVVAISAGCVFNLAAKADGTVTAWGFNGNNQCTVPIGLSNVVDVAAGLYHSLALKRDGTVVAWGDNTYGETSVPVGLTNVVAIAAGGDLAFNNMPPTPYSLALKSDGTVMMWGSGKVASPVGGLNNVIAIAAGEAHGLAIRTGPPTPVITLEPVDEFQVQGSNATFTTRGAGLYGVTYQWQTNGVNVSGATSAALTVTNVQAAQIAIGYRVIVSNEVGNLASSNVNLHFVTPPVILTRTLPTNPVVAYQSNLTLNVAATAPGIYTGFPLAYQWQFNGSNITGATGAAYTIHGHASAFGNYSVVVSNAAGSTNAAWQVIVLNTNGLLITLHPTNQYQIAGGSVTLAASGVGINPVTYQWTFNTINLLGATNAVLTLTNLQSAQQGLYNAIISDGVSSLTSSNATFTIVTPPVVTSQSTPTNRVCIYGNYISLAASFTAPAQTNGFPLRYQWRFNGTNLNNANTNTYSFIANDTNSGVYSLVVTNAAGSTNASWTVTVTNAINVTNDLLLIYNTNSTNSLLIKDYYLAHRPMVGGANVLGIGCSATNEKMSDNDFTNQILAPYLNWLTNNPAKHPQYIILFPDIPSRAYDYNVGSVQYALNKKTPGGQPFTTSINFNGTNDCIGYINKLAAFSANYSPGKLIISASAGGYSNTNYVLDGIRYGYGTFFDYSGLGDTVSQATNGLLMAGVSPAAILFADGIEFVSNSITYLLPHPTNAVNVSGYVCWGVHSSLDVDYATPSANTKVTWTGNSGWWIIKTIESHNGDRISDTGNFLQWFAPNAFGGTNYSNTPIGSCSNVEEPLAEGGVTVSAYFSLWATGHNFGVCAWNAVNTRWFQASGDPFVSK
jgi:Regulator of chromosome condensation (RCC1) repeat